MTVQETEATRDGGGGNDVENRENSSSTSPQQDDDDDDVVVTSSPSPQPPRIDSNNEEENEQQQDNNKKIVNAKEIVYGIDSFYVIVQPVLICMILSALAVVYINTPETIEAGQAAISNSYNVYGNAEQAGSTGQQLSAGLINAIVIVVVITVMTFFMVMLYYFRCMKILIGYLILASMLLLCYISSVMFNVAVQKYSLRIDKVSFWLFIYNFGVVGTASIFFQRGFPPYITQSYLILTSVIVAWQLSFFDPWTAWILLIMLALYDLFAVLSPCGPLKALVNLMSRDNAPEMPGLLYEANLPTTGSGGRRNSNATANGGGSGAPGTTNSNSNRATTTSSSSSSSRRLTQPTARNSRSQPPPEETTHQQIIMNDSDQQPVDEDNERQHLVDDDDVDDYQRQEEEGRAPVNDDKDDTYSTVLIDESTNDSNNTMNDDHYMNTIDDELIVHHEVPSSSGVTTTTGNNHVGAETPSSSSSPPATATRAPRLTGYIPLALAKVYKLPLVADHNNNINNNLRNSNSTGDGEDVHNQQQQQQQQEENHSAEELRRMVHVVFPRGGGRIQPKADQRDGDEETRYDVIDRRGTIRRTLFVNDEGRVFNDLRDQNAAAAAADEDKNRNNIRLGLGDFIFYSILVSEAAVYSFTTFAACTLVILVGLGLTLLLLAVRGKALPALPISIFLGVVFYLLTRYLLQPWIEFVFIEQAYV